MIDSLVDRGQELVSQRLVVVVVVVVGLLSELPHSTIPFSPTGNMRMQKTTFCSYVLGSCLLTMLFGQSLVHYRFITVLSYTAS